MQLILNSTRPHVITYTNYRYITHGNDSEQKRPAINLKNVGPNFFQDYQNEISFNLVHLCPSMLLFPFAVFLLSSSTVLSSYCNVSFYFLDILGVMNVHHSEADGMLKLRKHGAKTL